MSTTNFFLFIKEKWKTTIFPPLIISIILICIQFLQTSNSNWLDYLGNNILSFILQTVLIFMFIDFPLFLLDEFNKLSLETKRIMEQLSNETKNSMNKINDFPSFMAFHTEKNVMGKKIESLQELSVNSSKWMYSKFISKLLTTSFEEFTIQFKETTDYSEFSTCIMQECTESVYLTGSMTPYEWLSTLAKNDESRNMFFDNMELKLDVQNNNHSLYLRDNGNIRKKKRFVCLSNFDYCHLFLFERSIREYYRVNNGIDTEFINWEKLNDTLKRRFKHMDPLTYEYALYDATLIFKFDKEKKILTILREDKEEFNEIKKFFSAVENKTISGQGKKELLESCLNGKITLLESIKSSFWQIPHKFAYLFHDEWGSFVRDSDKFGEVARNASANLLGYFMSMTKDKFNLVEIGPGIGDKMDLVCDRIGTERIISYTLIDICLNLLNDSFEILKKRLSGKSLKKNNLDCCSYDFPTNIFNDKTVLILNNSTIFTEQNFPWQSLNKAKRIIITLDKFDNNSEFNEYYKARGLFLSPLKIFGIPIPKTIDDPSLFSDNSMDSSYNNSEPYYKVFFNLKKYLENDKIKEYYKKNDLDDSNNPLSVRDYTTTDNDNYAKLRKEFDCQEKIIVLSSLKFKKEDGVNEKIKKFFIDKGFKETIWNIEVKDEIDASFVGIMIVKKSL